MQVGLATRRARLFLPEAELRAKEKKREREKTFRSPLIGRKVFQKMATARWRQKVFAKRQLAKKGVTRTHCFVCFNSPSSSRQVNCGRGEKSLRARVPYLKNEHRDEFFARASSDQTKALFFLFLPTNFISSRSNEKRKGFFCPTSLGKNVSPALACWPPSFTSFEAWPRDRPLSVAPRSIGSELLRRSPAINHPLERPSARENEKKERGGRQVSLLLADLATIKQQVATSKVVVELAKPGKR